MPHGGGAFSGKDPSKVDRSAAYMARFVAKTIVKRNLAKRALIQLAYAIGVARPISVAIQTFGTNIVPESNILHFIQNDFDLRPRGIIDFLNLNTPIYHPTRLTVTSVAMILIFPGSGYRKRSTKSRHGLLERVECLIFPNMDLFEQYFFGSSNSHRLYRI